jgi:hypothetical protein
MKIFYELPDSDNEREIKLLQLLFENYKLKMMWKLRKIEDAMTKENGSIFLDQVHETETNDAGIQLRFEGFSDQMVIVINGLLAGMPLPQ